MKIRLIEPGPPGAHVWAKTRIPRLGLPIIAAALAAQGHEVCIYSPQLAPIDWDDVSCSGLVGLSTTTSTALAAYEMADQLRAQGVPVVIGGSHVTFMANEALEHADYVARGEGGEQLMAELIEALSGDRELDSIAGLSFRRDGGAVHTLLAAHRLALPLHAAVHASTAVPLVGQGDHPQLAQGRSQSSVHGRSQTHGAAACVRRDDEPGLG